MCNVWRISFILCDGVVTCATLRVLFFFRCVCFSLRVLFFLSIQTRIHKMQVLGGLLMGDFYFFIFLSIQTRIHKMQVLGGLLMGDFCFFIFIFIYTNTYTQNAGFGRVTDGGYAQCCGASE